MKFFAQKIIFLSLVLFFPVSHATAQSADVFERAKVLSVDTIQQTSETEFTQRVHAQIITGDHKEEKITIDYQVSKQLQTASVKPDETIVIVETEGPQGMTWYVVDHYRIPSLFVILILFLTVAIFFAKKRAIYAILGLSFSIFILTVFIVPQIAQGHSPLLVAISGSAIIVFVSLFLAHGFHRKTTIALIGIILTIIIAAVLSTVFVHIADLFGFGSDAAYDLQFFGKDIELRGLLLAGMIIGTLGVLDDVTTALVATIHELHETNPKMSAQELFTRGMRVGREHIVSLINTLVLAYAGASLPLLLLFTGDQQPFWVTLNSQLVGEEIVRTLVGSTALVLAVPITAAIAVFFYKKQTYK